MPTRTFRPASQRYWISSSSDSRTETSSSTTKTIDVTSGMVTTSIERAAVAELTVYGGGAVVPA